MNNLDKKTYTEYLKISLAICRNSFLAEEVLNNVIVKLLISKPEQENEKAYVRQCLLNEFLYLKRHRNNNFMSLDDLFERDLAYIVDFDATFQNEDELFQAEINKLDAKRVMVIRSLLDNPDESYVNIAKMYKIDYNTFKATVRQSFNILKNSPVLKGML